MSRTRIGIHRAVAAMAWAIVPEKLEAILDVIDLRGAALDRGEELHAADLEARAAKPSAPTSGRAGAIAVIPVFGVIAQRMDMMTNMSGGTSTEALAAQIDDAIANPDVRAIVLNIDSPGGAVTGTPELASRIAAARGAKPIVAQANSLAASAAYWIASAADEIAVTPSGEVGSIGVYAVHTDISDADAKLGVKRTLIKAGRFKAEGNPYGPLGEDAQAAMQGRIDEMYDMFVRAVASNRNETLTKVREGYGQGRVLGAQAAVAEGMADRVATLDETLVRLGAKTRAGGGFTRKRAESRVRELAHTIRIDRARTGFHE